MNGVRVFLKKIKRVTLNQDGSVLVIVAALLIGLIGFSAILVDAGRMYQVRRQMVTAADAAALAGARELKLSAGNTTQAADMAVQYAILNGAETCDVADINQPADGVLQVVDVTVHRNVEYAFARVLGFNVPKDIKARAVATWGYYTEASNIIPFYYEGETAPSPGEAYLHVKGNKTGPLWGIFELQNKYIGNNKINLQGSIDILSGNKIQFSPAIKVDAPYVNFSDEYAADIDEFADPGFKDAFVAGLDSDKQSWDYWGRLYKYHQVTYHSYPNTVSLYGLVPIVTKDPNPPIPAQPGLIINGFAVYEIQDIIVQGNNHIGSKYSVFAGATHTPVDYSDRVTTDTPFEEGTIIGRFVGGDAGWVQTPIGDDPENVVQNINDPNAAKYLRLIDPSDI